MGEGCIAAINSQLRCHKHHLHVQHIREKITQASMGSPTYYPGEENKRTDSWYHFYLFLTLWDLCGELRQALEGGE